MSGAGSVRLFVCGDVMTGRGIDQILRHPCESRLYEDCVKDARDYVALAERVNGDIPRGVQGAYLWENVRGEWREREPLIKIVNLETAVTAHGRPWENKGINYRMHPRNIEALGSAGFDICSLANNHVLDWHEEGLEETLQTLRGAGIRYAGAGAGRDQAMAPALHSLPDGRRLLVFSLGAASSGIPARWAATPARPGVYWLEEPGAAQAGEVGRHVEAWRREGDLVVISIHWGANWGYAVPRAHRDFAHRLIDEYGAALVCGHSSHHPLGVELHRGRPVLYGCGDFINDYEGIGGFGSYRGDLCLMYFLEFEPDPWELRNLEVVPLQIRKFQLHHASPGDRRWLLDALNRASDGFHTRFIPRDGHAFCTGTQTERGTSHAI